MKPKTLFIMLHVIAIFCGFFLLFITIPLHLIYNAITNRPDADLARADAINRERIREMYDGEPRESRLHL